jgi:hypothetical protein
MLLGRRFSGTVFDLAILGEDGLNVVKSRGCETTGASSS